MLAGLFAVSPKINQALNCKRHFRNKIVGWGRNCSVHQDGNLISFVYVAHIIGPPLYKN